MLLLFHLLHTTKNRYRPACGGMLPPVVHAFYKLFSFALSGLEIKEVMNLFPGAYAPGYALFRPFGPNRTPRSPPPRGHVLHRGLVRTPRHKVGG